MKVSTLLLITCLAAGIVAAAQERAPTPVAELGINYSFLHLRPEGTISPFLEHGGTSTVQYNFNRVFGLVSDLGLYKIKTANALDLSNSTFTYMFGPRLTWRMKGFQPYVQGLIGGTRFSHGLDPNSTSPRLPFSQNVLTSAVGVGVDIALSDHFALRPVQADYFITRLESPSFSADFIRHNFRYSGGIVFRFGAK
jgi:opacity protein-like surface antigen